MKDMIELYVDLLLDHVFVSRVMEHREEITMTPCEVFTVALQKGKIDEKKYTEAHKYFGGLWNRLMK